MHEGGSTSSVRSTKRRPLRGIRHSIPRLTLDAAFIAILIGAMDANQHVSREEAARAHHIIWSMKRFRRNSGDRVNRIIEAVRARYDLVEDGTAVADAAS